MAITNANLTTTPTAIFTSANTSVITSMYFCNSSSTTPYTFSMWLVKSGGGVGNINQVYNNVAVVARDTYVVDRERVVLDAGDAIFAYANAVNVIVWFA